MTDEDREMLRRIEGKLDALAKKLEDLAAPAEEAGDRIAAAFEAMHQRNRASG
jgi:DNA-binding FrmR family transcriptional regulator